MALQLHSLSSGTPCVEHKLSVLYLSLVKAFLTLDPPGRTHCECINDQLNKCTYAKRTPLHAKHVLATMSLTSRWGCVSKMLYHHTNSMCIYFLHAKHVLVGICHGLDIRVGLCLKGCEMGYLRACVKTVPRA